MKKGILVDLDGTLFDTGKTNYMAYQKALSKLNVEITEKYYRDKCEGRDYKEFLAELIPSEEIEEIHRLKKKYYYDFVDSARKNRLLFALIENCKTDFMMAVVTTASRDNAIELLRHYQCEDLFDFIIAKEDVVHLKPAPDAYFMALEKMGVSPQDAIIFEDSETGLKAACECMGATVFRVEKF